METIKYEGLINDICDLSQEEMVKIMQEVAYRKQEVANEVSNIIGKSLEINRSLTPQQVSDFLLSTEPKESKEQINKVPKLEKNYLGKPTCPNVEKNPKKINKDVPQAWFDKKTGIWSYNWKGAMDESKFLGKRIPSPDEWFMIAHSINPTITEKSKWQDDILIKKELGLELGYFDANGGKFGYQGNYGFCWSSVEGYNFKFTASQVYSVNIIDSAHGFPVRCVLEN